MKNTTASAKDDVLAAIIEHWREYFIPPTIRYVMAATGISTTSLVWYWYRRLERDGRIFLSNGKPVPSEIYSAIQGVPQNEGNS